MPFATAGIIAAFAILILYNIVKGPGLIILIPGIQKMVKVDLRVIVLDVPTQDVISRDNVSVKVNAVIYFRIVDPEKAVIRVANVFEAIRRKPLFESQTSLKPQANCHRQRCALYSANTSSMTCSPNATSSTNIFRACSTSGLVTGASKSRTSRSSTSISMRA